MSNDTQTINFELKEPKLTKYIYVNPKTNNVHIFLPIVGGVYISTDETCQATKALKDFFNGVLPELESYRDALQHDLAILPDANPLYQQKNARLSRILSYIVLCHILMSSGEFQSFRGQSYPKYPQAILNLLLQDSNVQSMLLRPRHPHSQEYLRFANYTFSLYKSRTSDEGLYQTINNKLESINRVYNTSRERLCDEAFKILMDDGINDGTPLDLKISKVIASLNKAAKKLFPISRGDESNDSDAMTDEASARLDFTREQRGNTIDINYCQNILCVDENHDLKNIIYEISRAGAPNLHSSIDDSLFYSLPSFWDWNHNEHKQQNISKILIFTQFFLAQVNFYDKKTYNKNYNLGMTLDERRDICDNIANIIYNGLSNSSIVSIEDQIISCLIDNTLCTKFTSEDIANIKLRTFEDFITIYNSPHYDEFLTFTPVDGLFVSRRGHICVDFAEVLKDELIFHVDDSARDLLTQVRAESEDINGILSDRNNTGEYQASVKDILSKVLHSLEVGQIDAAINLLSLPALDNKILLNLLTVDDVETIKLSKNFCKLKQGCINVSHDKAVIFDEFFATGYKLFKAVKDDDIATVTELVTANFDISIIDKNGDTALMYAIRDNKTEIAYLLINAASIDALNVKNKNNECVLGLALQKDRDMLWYLFNTNGVKVDGDFTIRIKHGFQTRNILEYSVLEGDKKLFLSLLNSDKISGNDVGFNRAFIAAARVDDVYYFDKIFPRIKDINCIDEIGIGALISAASHGRYSRVEKLLQHSDINVNLVDNEGDSALTSLVYNQPGALECLELLLAHPSINVNQCNIYNRSALWTTILKRNDAAASMLLNHKDINLDLKCSPDNKTVLEFALQIGSHDIALKLIVRGAAIDDAKAINGESLLQFLCETTSLNKSIQGVFYSEQDDKHLQMLTAIIKRDDIDFNKYDNTGNTILTHAINYNNTTIIDMLLAKSKVDITLSSNDANPSLLVQLAAGGSELFAKYMQQAVARKIDLNVKNELGESALVAAIKAKKYDNAKLLVESGADTKNVTIYGVSLQQYIVDIYKDRVMSNAFLGFVNCLGINCKDIDGRTMLYHALLNYRGLGQSSLVNYLLDIGASFNDSGLSKQDIADIIFNYEVDDNNKDVLKKILQKLGADYINTLEIDGLPILYASYDSKFDFTLFNLLLDLEGINIECKDSKGVSLFDEKAAFDLVSRYNLEGYKKFTAGIPGFDVNKKNEEGNTLLIYAVRIGAIDISLYLLTLPGIDVNATDLLGRTAYDFALETNNDTFIERYHELYGIPSKKRPRDEELDTDDITEPEAKRQYIDESGVRQRSISLALHESNMHVYRLILEASQAAPVQEEPVENTTAEAAPREEQQNSGGMFGWLFKGWGKSDPDKSPPKPEGPGL